MQNFLTRIITQGKPIHVDFVNGKTAQGIVVSADGEVLAIGPSHVKAPTPEQIDYYAIQHVFRVKLIKPKSDK